jgi:hypothetical protein
MQSYTAKRPRFSQRRKRHRKHRDDSRCRPDAMGRRRLHERRVHFGHALAAILPMMPRRRAGHGIAAIHRFFGGPGRKAVNCVRRQNGSQQRHENCPCRTHRPNPTRRRRHLQGELRPRRSRSYVQPEGLGVRRLDADLPPPQPAQPQPRTASPSLAICPPQGHLHSAISLLS